MPKTTKSGKPKQSELPSTLRRSSAEAQRTWAKAHDSAVETYGEGERAHRTAYSALKHKFEKKGDRWVKKAERGPSDPQAARGPTTPRKSTDEPRAPTAGGKVARTAKEARQKAREARQEYAAARRRGTRREGES